ASTTAGGGDSFTVTAFDAFNNVATGYSGVVTLSSSDTAAAFTSTTYTFTSGSGGGFDNGVHAFSSFATLKTAGSRSLAVTDASHSLTVTQSGIAVAPSTASSITVSGYVASTTAGLTNVFTVTAKDAYNNVAPGYLGTITLSSGDTQASFSTSVPYSFTAADA